jgi:hypothetical protein
MTVMAPGLTRRAFIGGTAVAAASAWLLGPTVLGSGRNGLERLGRRTSPISVGFVGGAASLAQAAGRLTVPATRSGSASPALAGGLARIEVLGLASATAAARDVDLRHLYLDALLLPQDATDGEPLTFHAWSLHRGLLLLHSGRVAFTWSVSAEPLVGFRLDVARGRPSRDRVAEGAPPPVSVLGAGGLREGLYLLGLAPGTWDSPTTVPATEDHAAWEHLQSVAVTMRGAPDRA